MIINQICTMHEQINDKWKICQTKRLISSTPTGGIASAQNTLTPMHDF